MRKLAILFIPLILSGGCKLTKSSDSKEQKILEKVILEDVVIKASNSAKPVPFQPMANRMADLLHTRLELNFNLSNQTVAGKATLKLKPFADPITNVHLDAQGFELLHVAELKGKDTVNLNYSYKEQVIQINLAATKSVSDTFLVYIDYIAKPNQIKGQGGKAITDNKGLYFINPDGKDPNKPTQIWTQGETRHNSCWFPTIDEPAEKHTSEFFITIPENWVSLSNGLLISSKPATKGFKTDYWKQNLPHSTYLSMLAIGDFKITKDSWRGKEVSYYLEPDYHRYARTIFGKTPRMIEFFSQLTGVAYPWEKFSQVVARDFVSGAMENTSAVLHYEGVQHSDREHLDKPQDDIIVHELFHHWFGDLVTARSWSQLPLNESFASYGEYLWNEHEFGYRTAGYHFERSLNAYIRSKHKHKTPPIRYRYRDPDELFDVLSYQKGARILHYLRYQLGDSAFFRGIRFYLTIHAFKACDIHDLRHAFEEASGRDLTAFFDRWFLSGGHPILDIEHLEATNERSFKLVIKQIQDSSMGIFHLPISVRAFRENLPDSVFCLVSETRYMEQEIKIEGLLSVCVDENAALPGQLFEKKSMQAWLTQLGSNQIAYGAFLRAAKELANRDGEKVKTHAGELIKSLLHSPEWTTRLQAINLCLHHSSLNDLLVSDLQNLARTDKESRVRAEALVALGGQGKSQLPELIFALNDSSYQVVSTAIGLLASLHADTALLFASRLEHEPSGELQETLSDIYAGKRTPQKLNYFKSVLGKFGLYRHAIFRNFCDYLSTLEGQETMNGLSLLKSYVQQSSDKDLPLKTERFLNKWIKEIEQTKKQNSELLLKELKALQEKLSSQE